MSERRKDEYDRPIYADDEVPPPDAYFAQWRGRTCVGSAPYPGNTITPTDLPHGAYDHRRCVGGWFPSGEWWLHCGRHRKGERE